MGSTPVDLWQYDFDAHAKNLLGPTPNNQNRLASRRERDPATMQDASKKNESRQYRPTLLTENYSEMNIS